MARKGGIAIICVGMTGSGKSTLVKRFVKNIPRKSLFVYDVNREYFPDRPYLDIDKFMDLALLLNDSAIIFEEATIFFSNRGSNAKMRELLVRKRHARNIIFLVFHSVRTIPHYIYDLCTHVYVFRTNDSAELVQSKHALIYPAWKSVQNKVFKYGKDVTKFCQVVKLN